MTEKEGEGESFDWGGNKGSREIKNCGIATIVTTDSLGGDRRSSGRWEKNIG